MIMRLVTFVVLSLVLAGCASTSLNPYQQQLRQEQLDKARQTPSLYRSLR